MPLAVATFSESASRFMGSVTQRSLERIQWSPNPSPSLPSKRAVRGFGRKFGSISAFEASTVATVSNPFPRRSCSNSASRSAARRIGIRKTLPTDTRIERREKGSAPDGPRRMPSAPRAAALRMIPAKLVGSAISGQTTTIELSLPPVI